ncbi:MAG: glycosyltransferase family 2 protein, partial [Bacteroidota bacterium]|nr:glycosyltransferase family 2 protein [Bacteroidota bacterium]
MNISVIIPSYNEQDSLIELSNEIIDSLKDSDLKFELIFIDDGSTDNSWNIINNIVSNVKVYDTFEVRAIKFKKNFGKSFALDVGFRSSKGDVVITMDADLQDDPKEILPLYDMIVKDKYDIVSGWKKTRLDPLSKTIPTKLYNWATRKVSGINLHDFNCGLKAYSSDLAEDLSLSGEMHRY